MRRAIIHNRCMRRVGALCLVAIIGSQFLHLSRVVKKVVPAEYQLWDHPVINKGHPPNNETISVCLLTYDDNHFLIEWLAFHYQTLPLRRLIVASDPRSRTSPSKILERWKGYMNITEWRDRDYFPLSYRRSIVRSKQYPTATDKLVLMHRYRQRFFYRKCMQQLKREYQERRNSSSSSIGQNWVAFIDVDEFLFPNRNWKYQFLLPSRFALDVKVADLLYRHANLPAFHGPCIGLPRLLIGTNVKDEDALKSELPLKKQQILVNVSRNILRSSSSSSSSPPSLMTLTWKWHEELSNNMRNKAGKALIDLSRVSPSQIELGQIDVHRPVMDICSNDHMWTSNIDSPLVLHHYVGTHEQFTFRSDPRQGKRTTEAYQEFQLVNYSTVDPGECQAWLVALVQSLGEGTVRHLLQGAGQVETNVTSPVLGEEESYQKLLHEIFPAGIPLEDQRPSMMKQGYNNSTALS